MIQLVVSIALIVMGLFLSFGLLGETSGDVRAFGWLVTGMGVLGLILRLVLARLSEDRQPPPGRR